MATSHPVETSATKDIMIIGGSCAGLMAGILLKRQGHRVQILEQAVSSEREGLAAGIGLSGAVETFFDENDRLAGVPMSVDPGALRFLHPKALAVTRRVVYPARMTTWDACYYRLRANFDGLRRSYCLEPLDGDADAGESVFETGKRVTGVALVNETVSITAEDVKNGGTHIYEADAVIMADGANSRMREQLQPLVKRESPGYVLWRGTVPTSTLSQECLNRLEGDPVLYAMKHSYAVIYTIPGENGSLQPGERAINFGWYDWTRGPQHLHDILTDTDGHAHRSTLPKGKMRAEIWKAQLRTVDERMHPLIAELAHRITHPFVSVVSSIGAQRAVYFDERLFFVGDALVQIQPNMGGGMSKAANDVLLLAKVFDGELTAAEWEQGVLRYGEDARLKSRAFAAWWLCTWWGFIASFLRLRLWLGKRAIWDRWSAWRTQEAPLVRAKRQ
ncbi:hypothetical protein LTR53_002523 [Teratosphaeriaceae sp. CCFEE 6253]|nr:hypothetical protein LTR53_002523 [Teratosphaeriaceae sp. CCFEE 6253]